MKALMTSYKTKILIKSSHLVGGLMNGCIKVFNVGTGALNGTLENDETTNEAMPISRIRCNMAIPVVEVSREGYKIRKVFA